MKLKKLLLIISIVAMALGFGCFVAASVLALSGEKFRVISDIFFGVSSILGIAALGLLVYNLAVSSKNIVPMDEQPRPKVVVKVVDVKDVPKSKEQKLYEQYENLYKQGLITKEDLDNKHKELLEK